MNKVKLAFTVFCAHLFQGGCDGTGRLYLVGCGYNAYPVGSEYGEYPQMDNKEQDRQRRKYRYIIHAEQNALTFRSGGEKRHGLHLNTPK